MGSSNRLIVLILVVAALAVGFWVLVLGPKRNEADDLASQVEQLQVSLAEAQSKATEASAARHQFPADYRQLVVLGKAVPANDDTSSLLVELSHISTRAKVKFQSIQLNGSGEEVAAPATSTPTAPVTPPATPAEASSSAVPAAATLPPTEAAASVMPLGAAIGPAGLAVMPYNLAFSGDFFHVADFIQGIDSLVHTSGSEVAVDGRLVTLDGFALSADAKRGFPYLSANFAVTTYLTPPSQGVTAGATATAPAPSTTTPAATTSPTESAGTESATVSAEQ
jgi:Tfp pilus assembly protein PilO